MKTHRLCEPGVDIKMPGGSHTGDYGCFALFLGLNVIE
jgi:hypothetical protein